MLWLWIAKTDTGEEELWYGVKIYWEKNSNIDDEDNSLSETINLFYRI